MMKRNYMKYSSKTDPLTGEQFYPSRYNQKFSCRKNQVAYNNVKARDIRHEKAPFDKAIEKNRKVLSNVLLNADSAKISRDYLLGAGFNFNVFNGSYQVDREKYQTVYHFAITRLNDGKFKVIKRERNGK